MKKLAYEVIKDNVPSLREKSVEVKMPLSKEDEEVAKFLHDYLVLTSDEKVAEEYGTRPGVGLAAPQIGINKRMVSILINYPDENGNIVQVTEFTLINPKIVESSTRNAYLMDGEGCLSVDENHPGHVIRSAIIVIEAYDYLTKRNIRLKLRGYEAIVAQHELDHLEGILFYDRIDKKDPFKRINGALEI